jgi:hypothetical protein
LAYSTRRWWNGWLVVKFSVLCVKFTFDFVWCVWHGGIVNTSDQCGTIHVLLLYNIEKDGRAGVPYSYLWSSNKVTFSLSLYIHLMITVYCIRYIHHNNTIQTVYILLNTNHFHFIVVYYIFYRVDYPGKYLYIYTYILYSAYANSCYRSTVYVCILRRPILQLFSILGALSTPLNGTHKSW